MRERDEGRLGRLLALASVFAGQYDGQDLIEYGLLVGLIAVVAFFAVTAVGAAVNTLFWQTFPSAI